MSTPEQLAEQFEEHRSHVRAVAYRMLGSVSEAEDAVQEAWIRLSRTDVSDVDNLRGWGRRETTPSLPFTRTTDGRVLSVIGFTIAGGKVVEMDILADPDRLSRLDLSAIEP